jgi:hypothetical protein
MPNHKCRIIEIRSGSFDNAVHLKNMSNIPFVAECIGDVMGVALIGMGIHSHIDPVYGQPETRTILRYLPLMSCIGARDFGFLDVTKQNSVCFPVVCGRNITLGLTVLMLSWQGKRRAMGTVFIGAIAAGISDSWTCWRNNSARWRNHAVGTATTAVLGWCLLQPNSRRG